MNERLARLAKSAHAESIHDRAERLAAMAADAFSHHEIKNAAKGPGRWIIQRKGKTGSWEQSYWTEIITLAGGKILVHGDIAAVIFAYYIDSRDPIDMIRWMGRHRDWHYITEKATIGSGHEVAETCDPSVAAWQIASRIEDIEADDSLEADETVKQSRFLYDALHAFVAEQDIHALKRTIYEADADAEFVADLGVVTDASVFYAHAALRRLCELTDAEVVVPITGTP